MDGRQSLNRATAQAAASFLDKVTAGMPFPIKAIQVGGGSEFMAQFEQACEDKGLALYLLPPRSPQMNGAVERCNGAWRYAFYETYELPGSVEKLNPILDAFQHLYNNHKAPRSPCRTNPSPVSRNTLSQRRPRLSYVLIPDTGLPRPHFVSIPRRANKRKRVGNALRGAVFLRRDHCITQSADLSVGGE